MKWGEIPSKMWVLVIALWIGCHTPQAIVPIGRAHYLYHAGYYERAIADLEREVIFRPSAEAYYLLGASYSRLAERSGDPVAASRAEQAFRAALERDPNHAATYYELCGLLVRQGRIAEARELVEGWAARNPNRAEPRLQLARLEWLAGNQGAAEDQLVEALALEPKNHRALAALGMIREQSGLLAQANRSYQLAEWFDPTQPSATRFARAGSAVARSPSPAETSSQPPGASHPSPVLYR